jgi:hypothetical protein
MSDGPGFDDIIVRAGVKQTESQDGAVLLDIEQGICFGLNAVGLRIWEMLKQRFSIEQIANSLELEFHVPRSQLISDICEFVAHLESKYLIAHENETIKEATPAKRSRLGRLSRFFKGGRA